MDAKKAKEMLEPIPSELVVTGDFARGNGECCAIGHLVRLTVKPEIEDNETCSDTLYYHKERSKEVQKKVKEIYKFCRNKVQEFIEKEYGLSYVNMADVNNSPTVNDYTQSQPKARVMNLLNDMIEAGY